MAFGLSSWHWFFLAQPYDLPERLLAADPEKTLFRSDSELFHPEAMEEYVRCLRDPATIHATCEDYRAAATLDYEHDETDRRAGRRIACPVLALWGRQGFLEEHYDVLDVWRGSRAKTNAAQGGPDRARFVCRCKPPSRPYQHLARGLA